MSQDDTTSLSKDHDSPVDRNLHKPQNQDHLLQKTMTEQPGLEVAPATEGDKQVVQPEKEVVRLGYDVETREQQFSQPLIQPEGQPSLSREQPRSNRICGMKRGLFWGLLIVCLVFVLGLAIGLGVGLGTSDSDGSEKSSPTKTATDSPAEPTAVPVADTFKIGGGLSERFYSREGAWNGTGIATNWQRFASNFEDARSGMDNLVVYYQHHSGAIRWMRQTTDGDFTRLPSNQEIVAEDAKNSTPIAAVHLDDYERGLKLWHVFCMLSTAFILSFAPIKRNADKIL
jgi:hypothetical protein